MSFPCFCVEQRLSSEEIKTLRPLAIAENPANVSPFEAAALRSTLWQPGRTLRVMFLNGDPLIQQNVAFYAQQWSQHAQLTFAFVQDVDAEIRISFVKGGSWSAVGMEALLEERYPKHMPTMNFGWLTAETTEDEFSRVVLHEFGHALGMIHEHQSPAAGIQWNRQIVISELSAWPYSWSLPQIERNVFQRFYGTQTQFTTFDPHSIMLYEIPPQWTMNRQTFPHNKTLSQMDRHFIHRCYLHR